MLERFAWLAPDRLELSGTFDGLADAPRDAPVLVVDGADGPRRLPADPAGVSGPPARGRPWHAAFAWQEPPVPFATAELTLGGGLAVTLPGLGTVLPPGTPLELRGAAPRPEPASGASEPAREPQPELLGARQEARELRAALDHAQAELERAREDLRAERARHAADAVSFRAELETVRRSLEDELAAAREEHRVEAGRLRARLAAVREALGEA